MAIIYHTTAAAPSAKPRPVAWVDQGRLQAFCQYLLSIGLDPIVAPDLDPTEFCRTRDAAWEEVIRQICGQAPNPDANCHVPGVITRLGRIGGKQPAQGHELDDIFDAADLAEGPDEERFPFFNPPQLNAGKVATRYLIEGILEAGQPGGIFGAFKTLKTSVTADLLISLASGKPFLGQFPVAQPGRTLFFSGESDLAALQSIARRVCRARGLSLETLRNFEVSPKLPQLNRPADLRALRRIIRDKRPVCVAIDPAYLAIRGEEARSLVAIGGLLRPLADLCVATGCTILIVHHCKRSQQTSRSPATLQDIAWSGFAEFSAQWLTLARRRPFDAELGRHELWLNAGGRAGHHGLWALDVSEGVRGGLEPRKWKTAIRSVSIAQAQTEERTFADNEDRRTRRIAVTFERHRQRVLDTLARRPAGETARSLRLALGLSGERMTEVLESLLDEKRLDTSKIERHERTETAYRLPPKAEGPAEPTGAVGQVVPPGQPQTVPPGRDSVN